MDVVKAGSARTSMRGELSKELILNTGLRLADEEGLDAVSFRRIGTELGVTPMALYRHVGDKESLLDELGGLALAALDKEPAADVEWHEQLREIFTAVHAALTEHPGLVRILQAHTVTAQTTLQAVERLFQILCTAGFSGTDAVGAIAALESFTFGFASQAISQGDPAERKARESRFRALPKGDFPHTTRFAKEFADWNSHRQFHFGLDLIIGGLRSQIDGEATSAKRPARRGKTA